MIKNYVIRLKYVQFCTGYKLFQNVNISLEICVNVFQLIQNVKYFIRNMWKCVWDVCIFFQNVNISIEICVNVFQMIQNVNISLEICANVSGI